MYKNKKGRALQKNTSTSQYWKGFIAADGCIHTTRISLVISSKDSPHLTKYGRFVKAKVVNENYEYSRCAVRFRNKSLVEQLRIIGITPNKSLTFKLIAPLNWNFLRGYFDGDGHISIKEYKKWNKKYQKYYVRVATEIHIVGSKRFLYQVKAFLAKFDIEGQIYTIENTKACRLRIHSRDSQSKFIHNIYKDAEIYLERKFRKAVEMRNHFDNYPVNSRNQHLGILSEASYLERAETIIRGPKEKSMVKG